MNKISKNRRMNSWWICKAHRTNFYLIFLFCLLRNASNWITRWFLYYTFISIFTYVLDQRYKKMVFFFDLLIILFSILCGILFAISVTHSFILICYRYIDSFWILYFVIILYSLYLSIHERIAIRKYRHNFQKLKANVLKSI